MKETTRNKFFLKYTLETETLGTFKNVRWIIFCTFFPWKYQFSTIYIYIYLKSYYAIERIATDVKIQPCMPGLTSNDAIWCWTKRELRDCSRTPGSYLSFGKIYLYLNWWDIYISITRMLHQSNRCVLRYSWETSFSNTSFNTGVSLLVTNFNEEN